MRMILSAALALSIAALSSAAAAPAPSPDLMAWQVFAVMTAPAGGPGVKAVAFETWASDSDIYAGTPKWPGTTAKHLVRSLAAVAEDHGVHLLATGAPSCVPKDGAVGNFPPGACIGEEVQHNRPVYDTIVANGLNTTAGLVKAFASGKPIAMPPDSIVVKADWVLVSDILRWLPKAYKSAADVRRAYYTNSATLNGIGGEYALVGMSAQSRQLPDWVWMTFEHRSNPGRCDVLGCHDAFGAAAANVTPYAGANRDYGPCAKTPALAALLKTAKVDPIWNNYCLKGTQTRFSDAAGDPTLLANSVIERMNKGVPEKYTSCISCHAYAAFNAAGTPNYRALNTPQIGEVLPCLLTGYKPHDYLWSVLAAH